MKMKNGSARLHTLLFFVMLLLFTAVMSFLVLHIEMRNATHIDVQEAILFLSILASVEVLAILVCVTGLILLRCRKSALGSAKNASPVSVVINRSGESAVGAVTGVESFLTVEPMDKTLVEEMVFDESFLVADASAEDADEDDFNEDD